MKPRQHVLTGRNWPSDIYQNQVNVSVKTLEDFIQNSRVILPSLDMLRQQDQQKKDDKRRRDLTEDVDKGKNLKSQTVHALETTGPGAAAMREPSMDYEEGVSASSQNTQQLARGPHPGQHMGQHPGQHPQMGGSRNPRDMFDLRLIKKKRIF